MAKVKGQTIPSAYAELYSTSLQLPVTRSGSSANTYNSFIYNQSKYKAGYAVRSRYPFTMKSRRGIDNVNAAYLTEIENTNNYQGHLQCNDARSIGLPLKKGRPSAQQLYCRNIFKKSANCWWFQPWEGNYIADAEQPIPKTYWYTSAAPDSGHYYNYFMKETMNGYHTGSKPLWCVGCIKWAVVADYGNQNVQSFDWSCYYTWKIQGGPDGNGHLEYPRSVKIYNSFIYVLDQQRANVQIYDRYGLFVWEFGTKGFNVGEMYDPRSMSIGFGKIYIADEANHKVIVFTVGGDYVTEWGTEGYGDGEFKDNEGVLCAFGRVYVSDYVRKDVQIFDTNGGFISKFDGSSGDANAFQGPTGMTNTEMRLLVLDTAANRIKIYDSDGTYGKHFQDPFLHDVVVTADHEIMAKVGYYWLPSGSDLVKVYTPAGVLQKTFSQYGDRTGQMKNPLSIDIIRG